MNTASYDIAPEFRDLLPPLTDEQRQTLKSLILSLGGCLNALVVWRERNVLLDGHHRSAIIQELMAEGHTVAAPRVEYLSFADATAAKEWVLQHAGGQRNLSKFEAAKNILMNEPLIAELRAAAEQRMRSGIRTEDGDPRSAETRGDLWTQLQRMTGIPRIAIFQTHTILPHPEIVREVEKGSLPLNRAYNKVRAKLAEQEFNAVADEKSKRIEVVECQPDAEIGTPLDQILNVDVLDGFKRIEKPCVSLVLTSPPYPITAVEYPNWKYDGDYPKYLTWMEQVFRESHRVLRDGGRLVVQFDTPNIPMEQRGNSGKLRHNLYQDFSNIIERIGFTYRDTILWAKQNCVGKRPVVGTPRSPRSPRIQRNWEYILVFHKGSSSLEGDKSLIDLTRDEFNRWTIGHWEIKPANRRETHHRCAFPQKLPHRITKLYTYRNDLVLDPFAGSGTTCVAAAKLGRRYIGFENCPRYAMMARERIKKELHGNPEAPSDLDEAA